MSYYPNTAPTADRASTKLVITRLVHLDRDNFNRARTRLTRGDVYNNTLLDLARDCDKAFRYTKVALKAVRDAKRALDTADEALSRQESRLTGGLEDIVDYMQLRVGTLHTGAYLNLLDPQQYPSNPFDGSAPLPITADMAPPPVPPTPSTASPVLIPPSFRTIQTARRGRPRTNTGSSTSSRQSRQQERNARIAYPSTATQTSPTPSTRSSSPVFRGTYEDFLALQESRFGRDDNGEIRVYDKYGGEESEEDEVQEVTPEDTEV